jgi:hypothetical protein
MTMTAGTRFFFTTGILACLGLITSLSQAQTVTASIRPKEIRPGQIATYTITIESGHFDEAPALRLPPQLGVNAAPTQSQQFNFSTSGGRSVVMSLSWPISGNEPGDFVIPPQEVRVNGQSVKTSDVQLKVVQSDAPLSDPSGADGLEPMLQIQVSKTEFYQGEMVPVTAMLFVNRQTNLRRMGLIEVAKDDFAIQRFPQNSEQTLEMLGGQPYYVFTFRSMLSALKTGKLDVGPAKMEVLLDVPMMDRGPPSLFGQVFGEPRKLTVNSQKVSVTVLPLPDEGKPTGFSGAVGEFQMSATASPASVAVGDPVTVEVAVSGSGNFDALTAPALTNPAGWKTYPARRYIMDGMTDPNLAASMERRIGFTQVLVPEKQHTAVPPFEMSFFSPSQKQYITLKSSPVPITIAPGESVPGESATGTGVVGAFTPQATAPEADITDILLHIPAKPRVIAAPGRPLLKQPLFWIVNAIPAAALLAISLMSSARKKREAEARSPLAPLRALWQELGQEGQSRDEFYRRAAHFIHLATPRGVPLSDSSRAVLERYETASFSGQPQTADASTFSRVEQSEVLAALAPLLSTERPAPAPPPVPRTAFSALAAGLLLFQITPDVTAAAATDVQQRYDAIVKAVEAKDFDTSARLAEALLADGVLSPEVFELLGHSRYRKNDYGRATLWYRRAELFTPFVPELRQNIRHLREKFQTITFPARGPGTTFGLFLTRDQWTLLAAAGGWLVLAALALITALRTSNKKGWFIGLGITGGVLLITAVTGYLLRPSAEDRVRDRQIVTAKESKAYTAASITSGSVIDLPPGSEVRLVERRGAWSYIEIPGTPDPLRGWVETDRLATLWPWDERLVN